MNLLRSCFGLVRNQICDPRERHAKKLKAVSLEPMPVAMIPSLYATKKSRGELKYEHEVVTASADDKQLCAAAFTEDNEKRNQNQCVVPYEDNCILLQSVADDNNTYINASWVDGTGEMKKYIATQGPNMKTIPDFWRMIWQYNCRSIVMVTSLFEHARQQCERYWPTFACTFDSISVTSREAVTTAQYTIREFRVCVESEPEIKRIIRQFQLNSWKKNNLPFIGAVIELTAKLRTWRKGKGGPIVVHCSDGSGRTGTFICINELLEVIRADTIGSSVPLGDYAGRVAASRPRMLDKVEHFAFIYAVLSEFVRSGGGTTVIARSRMLEHSAVPRLLADLELPPRKVGHGLGRAHYRTRLDAELALINHLVKPLSVGECAGGHRIENRRKSRNVLIQPPERARPYLNAQDGSEGSDYINAIFIDGYREPNQYIVTQWPMLSTIIDFWCLVIDFQIPTIVLLNPFSFGNRKFPIFWPAKTAPLAQPMQVGAVELELVDLIRQSDKGMGAFVLSVCKRGQPGSNPFLPNRSETVSRNVILFYVEKWPAAKGGLESCDSLIQLAFMSLEWNSMQESNGPILVVSSDGVERVGVFCSATICIERLLAQSEVDVFRAVEIVKQNRPQLVNSVSDYRLCYECALRAAHLLSREIEKSELKRERDPIEIFNELDQMRTTNNSKKDVSTDPSVTSEHADSKAGDGVDDTDVHREETEDKELEEVDVEEEEGRESIPQIDSPLKLDLNHERNVNSPVLCRISSIPHVHKRQLPTISSGPQTKKYRCLPTVVGNGVAGKFPVSPLPTRRERNNPRRREKPVPILRSHRIIYPSRTPRHRRLPILDSRPVGPFDGQDSSSSQPSPSTTPRTDRRRRRVVSNPKSPNSFAGFLCHRYPPLGTAAVGVVDCSGCCGSQLETPRFPLVRTETETTCLTSSMGDLRVCLHTTSTTMTPTTSAQTPFIEDNA